MTGAAGAVMTSAAAPVAAKLALTADHVSGGRVELGIGAGWMEREHEAYGFEFATARERVARFAEQLEIVHGSWTASEPFSFSGRFYGLKGLDAQPRPLQQPHPPLIVGGSGGKRSIALAARWADEYNTHNRPPAELRSFRTRLDQACEAIGRDPADVRLSLMTGALIGADDSDLEARARQLMEWTTETGDARAYLAGRRPGEITGTVEQALEQLAAVAAAGVERVMLQHLLHDDLDFVALVGRDVIPAAAEL